MAIIARKRRENTANQYEKLIKEFQHQKTRGLTCVKMAAYIKFVFNCLHISSVVEFQRWWILKSNIFGQESTNSKDFFLNPTMNYSLSKSAKIALSKSILYVKNQSNFFKKYKLSMNINLGDFFSKFNFLTTLLSKIMPNFPHRNF